jgi:hypothetical protein
MSWVKLKFSLHSLTSAVHVLHHLNTAWLMYTACLIWTLYPVPQCLSLGLITHILSWVQTLWCRRNWCIKRRCNDTHQSVIGNPNLPSFKILVFESFIWLWKWFRSFSITEFRPVLWAYLKVNHLAGCQSLGSGRLCAWSSHSFCICGFSLDHTVNLNSAIQCTWLQYGMPTAWNVDYSETLILLGRKHWHEMLWSRVETDCQWETNTNCQWQPS